MNTLTHLATTYDGSALRLFVNGAQVGSKAATGSIATSTNPLQIGGDSIHGQFFAGSSTTSGSTTRLSRRRRSRPT